MQVRFVKDWTRYYQAGAVADVGPSGLSRGQFVELKRRGLIELVEPGEPGEYRTAVAVAPPKRKRGRPRKVKQ